MQEIWVVNDSGISMCDSIDAFGLAFSRTEVRTKLAP